MVFRTILIVLASLLMGAHFLRQGQLILVLLCLAVPFLLFHRKRWVLIALQCFAYGSALMWLLFMRMLVHERMMEQRPFRGVIIILGSVALVTFVSGLLLNSQVMKDRYPS